MMRGIGYEMELFGYVLLMGVVRRVESSEWIMSAIANLLPTIKKRAIRTICGRKC
jgi:hypothetical protein